MEQTSRKLTAILFTDIVGFTSLMRSDEKKALNLLYYNRQLLDPIIKKHNGDVLKEMGDGTLNSFPSAIEAVKCAIEIQEMLDSVPSMNLRMGVHIGDVIVDNEDIFGDGVNIASRIQDLAKPGGICISKAVFDSIQNQPDIRATSIGKHELKGIPEKQEIYSLNIDYDEIENSSDKSNKTTTKTANSHNMASLLSWAGGILFSIFMIFQIVGFMTKSKDVEQSNSIAVFPFENILKNEEFNWLSDGFSRTMTFKISEIEKLNVIDQLQILKTIEKVQPKGAGMAYDVIARKTAEKMNINFFISGSYQIHDDKIQITAQLVNVQSGVSKPLAMKTYPLSDLIQLQTDISQEISTILNSNKYFND